MHIAIIGAGNMGSAFAHRLAASGHTVALSSRDLADAEKVARQVGANVRVAPPGKVAEGADLIIAATPAATQQQALRSTGDLTGKIVVDIANPVKPDMSGLSVGHTTSFAEELAKALPGAKLIKAFNTVFAQVLREGPDFGAGKRAAAFYAGDDERAKQTVRRLIDSMGFEGFDSGPLQNARYLEPLGMLNIWFGYVAKLGMSICPTWLRRG
jgi:predicted dinucleotide-binding enzyme